MLKISFLFLFLAVLFMMPTRFVLADPPVASTPTLSAASLEEEKRRLELERLELENEKLRLELERMKLRSEAPAPVIPIPEKRGDRKEDVKVFQTEVSEQSGALSQGRKEEPFLLVPDFVNSEVWSQGVRYGLHELDAMAPDRGWELSKKLHSRSVNGYPRTLYSIKNLSLLKYLGKDRGIIEMTPPQKEDDLRFLSAEGITFDSGAGDVRNAYQNLYFKYDGQRKSGGLTSLRYKHSRGLAFADKLEFLFDKAGKMVKVRYGVLDEK